MMRILFFTLIFLLTSFEVSAGSLPHLSISDIHDGKGLGRSYVVEGYVEKTYTCPPCPKGMMCKVCADPYILITTNIPASKLMKNYLQIFTENPTLFEVGKKYRFEIEERNSPTVMLAMRIKILNYQRIEDDK